MSGIGTKCVQAGYTPGSGEPRQVPIIQSTTFKYASSSDMGKLFDLEASGYFYSRLQNPTNDTVAAKIAALEGRLGGHAHLLRSGGQFLCRVQHRLLRGSCGVLLQHLWRQLQSLCRDHEAHGRGLHLCGAGLHTGGAGRSLPSQYEGRFRRDHRQSGADGAGY